MQLVVYQCPEIGQLVAVVTPVIGRLFFTEGNTPEQAQTSFSSYVALLDFEAWNTFHIKRDTLLRYLLIGEEMLNSLGITSAGEYDLPGFTLCAARVSKDGPHILLRWELYQATFSGHSLRSFGESWGNPSPLDFEPALLVGRFSRLTMETEAFSLFLQEKGIDLIPVLQELFYFQSLVNEDIWDLTPAQVIRLYGQLASTPGFFNEKLPEAISLLVTFLPSIPACLAVSENSLMSVLFSLKESTHGQTHQDLSDLSFSSDSSNLEYLLCSA
jgi:hypothetical protein